MRVFVAVVLPADVADVLAELDRPAMAGLRWTTSAQWHVTMRFLGEVADPGPVLDALRLIPTFLAESDAAAEISADGGFETVLGPVTAWFPGRRVLHVPVRGLEALASVVARALAVVGDGPADGESAGANLDARPFAGHVTLARLRGDKSGPGRLAGVPVHASWDVDSLSLMGSQLGPGGARYETIGTVALLA